MIDQSQVNANQRSNAKGELRAIVWTNGILLALIGLALGLGQWLRHQASLGKVPAVDTSARASALLSYNLLSHGLWIAMVVAILIGLWLDSSRHQTDEPTYSPRRSLVRQTLTHIRQQPLATVVFVAISIFLISEASWFYKEIIGWYDDIYANNLLQNFSLRPNLIRETLTRNDFRFYPLAFADLQILSWFTPYVKVWMIFNAIELIITIWLGTRIAKRITKTPQATELLLMFSLLLIATAPSAFSYMQFIYSERILTLLFAVFLWNYLEFQSSKSRQSANVALAAALLGSFCKDTAILLFAIPAASTALSGLLIHSTPPPPHQQETKEPWQVRYQLELRILTLSLFFIASFLYLTYLPSIVAGEARYDADLTMNLFEPDARLLILIAFSGWRVTKILSGKSRFTPLDGANAAALAYATALYWLVGYSSSNYMALPIHFVAVIDLTALWCIGPRPWLAKRVNSKTITGLGLVASSALIFTELQFPGNTYSRIKKITRTHHSWEQTLNKAQKILTSTKEKGEDVNVIITKSLFRTNDHIKRLPYDRLIYLNEDNHNYQIIDGKEKGNSYAPQIGDFFLDLDTGSKRLKGYGLKTQDFDLIYKYSPNITNGHIYIKRR